MISKMHLTLREGALGIPWVANSWLDDLSVRARPSPVDPLLETIAGDDLPRQVAYIERLFELTDRIAIARVWITMHLYSRGPAGGGLDLHASVLESLRKSSPPASLVDVHALILDALEERSDFLKAWRKREQLRTNPRVASSSRKLQ